MKLAENENNTLQGWWDAKWRLKRIGGEKKKLSRSSGIDIERMKAYYFQMGIFVEQNSNKIEN
jgi:hypothetical protein